MVKLSFNEAIDKLDRTTEEYKVVKSENEKLKTDVKSLQADNALFFKKIVKLQEEIVSLMNSENRQQSISSSIDQDENSKSINRTKSMSTNFKNDLDIEFEEIKEDKEMPIFSNSYSIPSKPLHRKVVDECEVTALSYNFRGTIIATGSGKGMLRLWDTVHGSEVKRLHNFKQAIFALTFSTDNKNLCACYADGTIRVWSIENMKPFNSFHGHSDVINWSTYSHTNNSLITGSSDRQIKLWDISKGVWTKTFSGFSAWYSVDSVPYGSLFASGHNDGTVKFWTPTSKGVVKQMNVHDSAISSINFTNDGRYLMTSSRDHTIKLIDVKQFEEIWSFEDDNYLNGSNTSRSSISPGGDYAVVGSKNGSVIILKLSSSSIEIEEIYKGEHTSSIDSCAWQPTGGSFATADCKGNFIIWQ